MKTANARMRALIDIGSELTSERDPDRLLQRGCAAARELFGATYVTLGILDPNSCTVRRFVTCGADAENCVRVGDSVSGILGTVVAERRALRGENPGGSPAGLQFPLQHPEVQAFLAAPVASPSQVYGWFCLVGNQGRTFDEDDEELVTALSGQIGRIYENVTERRSLEEQYQHAQKMGGLGRLAGGVAHDFNNLVTAILGFCELLLADLDPDDPHRTTIAEIQKAGARAGGLTHQLLAFSRKQIIAPAPLDLNVVVADMRAMLGRLIGDDVKVVLALAPDLASVKADRGQVEQIVMNLAVNACDAMPTGGTLTIETANVDLDEDDPTRHRAVKPGPYVALTLTDTGTGMTAQVQARVFEPFFTTKEVDKGTGLGLATVHGIVARSGGSVNVTSEIGRGTSFKVYFPRTAAPEIVVEAPPAPRTSAGAETVLVVEDVESLRKLTRKQLTRQGYTVLVAANADEALRLFEGDASIDVVVTDVVMPGGSGPELTRQLVQQRPALKVIYMSGYADDVMFNHRGLAPEIAFLHKPFTSEALGRKIREVLDREALG